MSISIIRRADICANVPKRFAEQYGDGRYGNHAAKIGPLNALKPEELTPERINAIIGNDSWTNNTCDVCGHNFDVLVRIGQEPDYDTRWSDVCRGCLEVALGKLSE